MKELEEILTLKERLQEKLKKNERSISWFYRKHILDNFDLREITFAHRLADNGRGVLSDEIKEIVQDYIDKN